MCSRGGYRGGFCDKGLQLPPCLIEPMPTVSKMDPLLTRTKPISASDSTSGITELRMGGNSCATASAAREQ